MSMNCTIKFKVGDQVIDTIGYSGKLSSSGDLLESNITDEELIQVIKKAPDKWNGIVQAIADYSRRNTEAKRTVSITTLKEEKGLMGNCTSLYIIDQFPNISFPPNVENLNVLLLNNFNPARSVPSGRVITSLGKELWVLKNDKDVINLFALHLWFKENLKNYKINSDSQIYSVLEQIRKDKNDKNNKLKTILDLLLHFSEHTKDYKTGSVTIEGKNYDYFTILDKITREIKEKGLRTNFNDDFVNALNQRVSWNTNISQKGKTISTISITSSNLFALMSIYHPKVLEAIGVTKASEFHKLMSTNINEEITKILENIFSKSQLKEALEENKNGYYLLFQQFVNSVEPSLTYTYSKIKQNKIMFSTLFNGTMAALGFTFDTVNSLDSLPLYRGFKIYALALEGQEPKYYFSKHHITDATYAKPYKNLEEAQLAIDEIISKLDIARYSLIDLLFRDTIQEAIITDDDIKDAEYTLNLFENTFSSIDYIPVGTVVETLDLFVDPKTLISSEFRLLLEQKGCTINTLLDKLNKLNIPISLKSRILKALDSPQKGALFVYKLFELTSKDLNNVRIIEHILDLIENAGTLKYYIRNVSKGITSKGGYREEYEYQIIPLNDDNFKEYKKNQRTPIIKLLTAILTTLGNKFKIPIHIHTSEEIGTMFDLNVVNPNKAKAFIRNGEIYINSTLADPLDLLHEYVHLILGVLKTDRKLRARYEELLYLVRNTPVGKKVFEQVLSRYSNISEMDAMEEMFAIAFSENLIKHKNLDLDSIFYANKEVFENSVESIFSDWKSTETVLGLYTKSIEQIFTRFNKDVARLLNSDNFTGFDKTKTWRLVSNYVNDEIKNGNIKEDCNG